MLQEQLEAANKLVELLNSDKVYKLRQYIWWAKHSFIKSVGVDWDWESDDEGSSYKCYHITSVLIEDSKGFVDYLIKENNLFLINDLFNKKYINIEEATADKDTICELAKDTIGNEDDYDLIYILEDLLNIFKNQNDLKITENPGKEINTFIDSFIKEIRTITNKYDA
jgi:DNA-binding ferritin-like protein (Dps family)